MKNNPYDNFSLDIFEGPLPFLLQLVQRSEIDICDISLHEIINQYISRAKQSPSVDTGAEFIGNASFLLWLKSKSLLPKHEQIALSEEADLDPNFEIIYKLLEYCRFKEAAKSLIDREREQSVYYPRGAQPLPEKERSLGVEHLTLEELTELFRNALHQAASRKGNILEEEWKVADKLATIRALMKTEKQLPFDRLFTKEKSKKELIVTFLALLELMKVGEVIVGREQESSQVYCRLVQTSNLDRAKAPGFDDRKSVNISNIDRLTIVKPRELSHGTKSKFEPGDSIKIFSVE